MSAEPKWLLHVLGTAAFSSDEAQGLPPRAVPLPGSLLTQSQAELVSSGSETVTSMVSQIGRNGPGHFNSLNQVFKKLNLWPHLWVAGLVRIDTAL